MTSEDLRETDPEALTLFDHPPRKTKCCPGCGLRAEPYSDDQFCWLCSATGKADEVRGAYGPRMLRLLRGGR